jgi:hypothetical protein
MTGLSIVALRLPSLNVNKLCPRQCQSSVPPPWLQLSSTSDLQVEVMYHVLYTRYSEYTTGGLVSRNQNIRLPE